MVPNPDQSQGQGQEEEIDESVLAEILEGLPGVNLDEVKKNLKDDDQK